MNDVTGMPQNVVVLGGSSDLALALLKKLAGVRLQRVVLAGRDQVSLQSSAKELEDLGVGFVKTATFDARATGQHQDFAEEVLRDLGTIDLVLVAAGVLGTAELAVLEPSEVASAIETNFSGPAAAMTAFAKLLTHQGYGQIVVFSSVAGVRVRRSNFVYGSSKAGLDAFSQGLSDALSGSGVRVMIVRPGFVHTKMTQGLAAQPFALSAEDVASAVLAGLARQASVVWAPRFLRYFFQIALHLPRPLWRALDR